MRTLFDELRSFSEIGFRDIYQKFIYIHCRELLEVMFLGEIDDSITGLVAYCYIDGTEGISFRPFMLGVMKSDSLQIFSLPHFEDTMYVLRLRDGQVFMSEWHQDGNNMYLYAVDPEKYQYFDLKVINFNTDFVQELKNDIDESYSVSEEVDYLRTEKFAYLDKYRHPWFPDDVEALLYSEKNGIEKVWVRLKFIAPENYLFGVLLNEPYKDQGCHEGDLIELAEQKTEEDSFLVFTGRTAVLDNS